MNYRLFQPVNAAAGRWAVLDGCIRLAAVDLIFVVLAIGAVIGLHALVQRRVRAMTGLAATLTLAFGLDQLLARAGREPHLFQDHSVHQILAHGPGSSMPSDQATAAFTVAFGTVVFLHRRAGVALTGAAVLIGFAQVWAGVHYPGDIIAAVFIAAVSAFFGHVVTLERPAFPAADAAIGTLPVTGTQGAAPSPRRPDRDEVAPPTVSPRQYATKRRIPRQPSIPGDYGRLE